jgi:hypothetical protein
MVHITWNEARKNTNFNRLLLADYADHEDSLVHIVLIVMPDLHGQQCCLG